MGLFGPILRPLERAKDSTTGKPKRASSAKGPFSSALGHLNLDVPKGVAQNGSRNWALNWSALGTLFATALGAHQLGLLLVRSNGQALRAPLSTHRAAQSAWPKRVLKHRQNEFINLETFLRTISRPTLRTSLFLRILAKTHPMQASAPLVRCLVPSWGSTWACSWRAS